MAAVATAMSSTRSHTFISCRSVISTPNFKSPSIHRSRGLDFLRIGIVVLSLLEVATSRPCLWGRRPRRHRFHKPDERLSQQKLTTPFLWRIKTKITSLDHCESHFSLLSVRGGGESANAVLANEENIVTNTTNTSIVTNSSSSNETSTIPVIPLWKQSFPALLQKKKSAFQKIRLGAVDIYLLGTAHVSNDSSKEVQVLLETVQPDAIFVELCEARIPLLTMPPIQPEISYNNNNNNSLTNSTNNKKESLWSRAASVQQQQGSSSRLQALSTVMLTSVQEEYARELGVELGGEFQAAYRYWKKQRKQQPPSLDNKRSHHSSPSPHFILGDRPMHLTLRRAWESLWWWPKAKVFVGLLLNCCMPPNTEEIRAWLQQVLQEESDILSKSFEELRKHFPTLHRVIIHERDAYLAAKLTQTCRALVPGSVVVAIVGAGHVPGICQWLVSTNATQTPEEVLADLVTTKQHKRGKKTEDPQLLYDCIHQVTTLHDMPDESFVWAQQ